MACQGHLTASEQDRNQKLHQTDKGENGTEMYMCFVQSVQ